MYTTEFQQIEKEYELYKAKRRREKSLLIRTEKAPGGLQAASSSVSSFDASRDGLSSSSVGLSSLADRQELDQIKAELREATKENLKMRESLEEVQRTKDNFQFEIVEKHRALMRAQDDIRLLNDTLHKLQAEAIRCQSEHKRILQIEHVLQAYAHCSVCSNFVREPVIFGCGHIFCKDCADRKVEQIHQYPKDGIPTCRSCQLGTTGSLPSLKDILNLVLPRD